MRRDWEDEDDDWDEGPDDDEGDETVTCVHCGREVYGDAEQCPHCGNYFSAEEASVTNQPVWIIVVALICLAVALVWVFFPAW